MSDLPNNKIAGIKIWLNTIDTNNFKLADEGQTNSSMVDSSSTSPSESRQELELDECEDGTENKEQYENNVLSQMTALTFNNVNISNSRNVHLGHMFRVNGNLNINVIQCEERQKEYDESINKEVRQQEKLVRPACLIFPRYRWLAMDPLTESKTILEPVEIVVVGYTATTSSTVQARNIGIIRDFQTLNVESQGFNDIIYNFLIGCDSVVYEGRGWGVEGDHTSGYNHKSIGVAFVGNFKHYKPTERVLKTCQNLFLRGVSEGHLSKNYKILTSSQCSANVDLDALFDVFKSWDNFCEIFSNNYARL